MKAIASRDNARYKALAKLVASAKERRASGLSVLEGAHLLDAYLATGAKPEGVAVSVAALEKPEVTKLLERASPAAISVFSATLFDALSSLESAPSVIATVRTPAAKPVPRDAELALVLEDIQDPGNVGTLLRSAAAAGARHALLSPQCAFAWSPKVLRAAMGAHFALNVVEGADVEAFVRGYEGESIALIARGGRPLFELDLRKPCAILVGNEGAGLTPALAKAARVRATIPLPGRIESLNAAAAGAVALFEAVRQRAAKR
jgi:RNA methyltransferase, TrmH family